jgi:hypothetical protein
MMRFQITKVSPVLIEGIACPDTRIDPAAYDHLVGRGVSLGAEIVGTVAAVEINKVVNAAYLKVQVTSPQVWPLASTGVLTCIAVDQGQVELRDFVTKGGFELQTADGSRLAKRFSGALISDYLPFANADHPGVDPRKKLRANRNAPRATSNANFGPAVGALPRTNEMAYENANQALAQGSVQPPYIPADNEGTAPASSSAPAYLMSEPGMGVGRQARTQVPNRNAAIRAPHVKH